MAPDGAGLTCLFEVSDPGLFEWGPRADRVLLGGVEVRGVGSDVARPPGSVDPADASWGRPTGSAVVFVDSTGKKLQKAALGGTTIEDVTPPDTDANGDPIEGFPAHADVTFQQVVYHPSGRALGFVLTDTEGSAVWMSTNTGSAPKRLIWSHSGTIFGPIAFRPDGTTLYYAAHLKNGTRLISAATLGKEGRVTTGLWTGTQNVLRMVPAPGGKAMALDTGTGCDDRKAFVSVLDTTGGRALLPDAAGPTSVIGWVDDSTVLVAEGGCNGPTKLWLTPTGAGATVTLVVDGVDRGAVRVPDPTPPPPLPEFGANEGLA